MKNMLMLVVILVVLVPVLSGCTVLHTTSWGYYQVAPVYVPAPVEGYYPYPLPGYRVERYHSPRIWVPTPRQHGPSPSPRHQSPPRQSPPRHR